jgi:hypothetical protein
MKKMVAVVLLLAGAVGLEARGVKAPKRSWFELGGKASAFMGEEDFQAGIGAEALVNPSAMLGIRYELFDVRFGGGLVSFNLLEISSLDALIYLPMTGIEPYLHAGMGISAAFGSGSSAWAFNFRGGMGFDYRLNKNLKIFAEPGIIINRIPGAGTSTTFRLSAGARFGLIK